MCRIEWSRRRKRLRTERVRGFRNHGRVSMCRTAVGYDAEELFEVDIKRIVARPGEHLDLRSTCPRGECRTECAGHRRRCSRDTARTAGDRRLDRAEYAQRLATIRCVIELE